MRDSVLVLLLLTASSFTNCGTSYDYPPKDNPYLIVIDGAKNVKYSTISNTQQVMYYIHANYPAQKEIETISAALAKMGWEPMDYSLFDPKVKNSHAVGWMNHESDISIMKLWQGEWRNDTNDYIRYLLAYTSTKSDKEELSTLSIAGIYAKNKLIEKVKSEAKLMSPNKAL